MFLAWSDPTHAGRLSRLFKHKQATAEKRDGSRDDCKRLTAVTFFFTSVVFPVDDNIVDTNTHWADQGLFA